MTQAGDLRTDKARIQLSPGYLMQPFGWAAKPLAAMFQADASLYSALFTLSRQRMHLIALALAHWSREIDARFARLLFVDAAPVVLDAVLGRRPIGIKRALDRLPVGVLPRASYRQLVELLENPATAKLIHHADSVEEEYLALLHNIPVPLRRIAAAAIDGLGVKPEGLGDGLRILAARGVAPTFEALVADLAVIRQPAQFIARIEKLVQRLPLPTLMPPATVGGAQRIDDIVEICALAKRWKNCLSDCYLSAVNECRSAIYLWPHAETPAVCVVSRHGRLGWGLETAKGPENAELPLSRMDEICCAFDAAGIPKESAIEALEHAAQGSLLPRHRARRRRRRDADYDEMYQDVEAFEAAIFF